MGRPIVKHFFEEIIVVHYGTTVIKSGSGSVVSFQSSAVVSASTGTLACDIEGSNDGVTWAWVFDCAIAITTTKKSTMGSATNAYKYYRANAYTVSGTDATVSCNISFRD